MSWVKLTGEGPTVTLHTNGKITWNWAAHVMMLKPSCVELLHDAENNRLGFRGASDSKCLSVSANDDFSIQAKAHLVNAGIVIYKNYEATLKVALDPEDDDPTPLLPCGAWIELP